MTEIERIIEGWFVDGKILNNSNSTATIEDLAKAIEQHIKENYSPIGKWHKCVCKGEINSLLCPYCHGLREKDNDRD